MVTQEGDGGGRRLVTSLEDSVRDYYFTLKAVEGSSRSGVISCIFQNSHLGCFYENRLKVARLLGKPPEQ